MRKLEFIMREMKPNINKVSEDGGTGKFIHLQAKTGNFIRKKEKPVGRCEDMNNDVFEMVLQGKTKLFFNSLKDLYSICGVKL